MKVVDDEPKKRKLKTAEELLKEYPLSPALAREIKKIEREYEKKHGGDADTNENSKSG